MPVPPLSSAPQQVNPSLHFQTSPHSHPSAPGQGESVAQAVRQAPIEPGADEPIPQQDSPSSQAPSTPVVQAQPTPVQVQACRQVP
jgi:hypothetical protein